MSLTVLVGGARSGKSTLAVEIGRRFQSRNHHDAITFIATAPRSDRDMEQRIDRHITERPDDWNTIEEELDLVAAINSAPAGLAIIDCLTLWTSNLMFTGRTPSEINEVASAAAAAAVSFRGAVVVVTNEVGLGIVPDNELARDYRDLQGRVNQQFVERADRALHLVAGRATPLVDPWTLLDELT
jgi:adenosyl cobinamide kinase/adenosyl cobinamide phosphate guanylyltransferase